MADKPQATQARLDVLPALTGLRFIAALAVLLAHTAEGLLRFNGPTPLWSYYLAQLSGIGMPLFLCSPDLSFPTITTSQSSPIQRAEPTIFSLPDLHAYNRFT
jgi:hypothetical protein